MIEGIVSSENWIGDLPAPVREELLRACETVALPAGQVLHACGAEISAMYQVASGHLQVTGLRQGGGRLLLAINGPGNCLLETAILGRRPARHTTTALTDVVLNRLAAAEFWRLFHEHREIPEGLCVKLTRQIDRQLNALTARSSHRVAKCVALTFECLMAHRGRPDGSGAVAIELPFTQSDLADHLGVTRQSIQREITAFKESGILAKLGAAWVVLDPVALRAVR